MCGRSLCINISAFINNSQEAQEVLSQLPVKFLKAFRCNIQNSNEQKAVQVSRVSKKGPSLLKLKGVNQ